MKNFSSHLLGMIPGAAGAALGGAVGGPLGVLTGSGLGALLQGAGHATGSEAFNAPSVSDLTGTEDFLPNFAAGLLTDPLTYAGGSAAWRSAVPRAVEPQFRILSDLLPGERGVLGSREAASAGETYARGKKAAESAKPASLAESQIKLPKMKEFEKIIEDNYLDLIGRNDDELKIFLSSRFIPEHLALDEPAMQKLHNHLSSLLYNYKESGAHEYFPATELIGPLKSQVEENLSAAKKLTEIGRTANSFDWRPNEAIPEDFMLRMT